PDYVKVLAAFDLDDLGGRNPLLQPATTTMMWTEPLDYRTLTGYPLRGWFQVDLTDIGVRVITHTGDINGTTALIFRLAGDVSCAAFLNKNVVPLLTMTDDRLGRPLAEVAESIGVWPNRDLFPSVGIPAFFS